MAGSKDRMTAEELCELVYGLFGDSVDVLPREVSNSGAEIRDPDTWITLARGSGNYDLANKLTDPNSDLLERVKNKVAWGGGRQPRLLEPPSKTDGKKRYVENLAIDILSRSRTLCRLLKQRVHMVYGEDDIPEKLRTKTMEFSLARGRKR